MPQILIFPLPLPSHLWLVNSARPIGPPTFALLRRGGRALILSVLIPALA